MAIQKKISWSASLRDIKPDRVLPVALTFNWTRDEAAAQAERDAAARREQALRLEAEAADRRAAETELRVKREAEDEAKRIADEAARREADIRRRNRVKREAVAALVSGWIAEDVAKLAVTMIARRAVPHVSIVY
jgi:colicin import membrane protein